MCGREKYEILIVVSRSSSPCAPPKRHPAFALQDILTCRSALRRCTDSQPSHGSSRPSSRRPSTPSSSAQASTT